MTFNDTVNGDGLVQMCELLVGAADATISGSTALMKHFTRFINNEYLKVTSVILQAEDDWEWDDKTVSTTYPIATRSLIANQQDYNFGITGWAVQGTEGGAASAGATLTDSAYGATVTNSPLKVKRVEVTYDGTNWYRVTPFDFNSYRFDMTQTTINNNFQQSNPFYDLAYNAILLFPIPTAASTNGLKVWFERRAALFTTSSGTAALGIDQIFHPMLAIGASLQYCIAKGLSQKNDLAAQYADWEARLKEVYGTKEKDKKYTLQSSFIVYD